MRRIVAVTAVFAIVSAAAAVVKLGEASAQAPASGAAPIPAYQIIASPPVAGPPGGAGYNAYILRHPGEAGDAESNEMARLQGDEARFAQEVESLSRQLFDISDEKQRTDIKSKLQETLGKQFDAQQQMRESEVAQIEAKLKKLREIITKRNDARRTIIDKRFEQLLRESEGLGWNSPSVGPAAYGYSTKFPPQMGVNHYAPGSLPGVVPEPTPPPAPRRK